MDWNKILTQLTVNRLGKLASSVGMTGVSKRRKADLVVDLHEILDDTLKEETLRWFSGVELRELARELGVSLSAGRKADFINGLLAHDQQETELELSEDDFLLPDRERLDLPRGDLDDKAVELLPNRPGTAGVTLFFELQELLRRPRLSRAILAMPSCRAGVIAQLLGEGLDDLIESAVRQRAQPLPAGSPEPIISIILDEEHHGLGTSDAGGALVSLAKTLGDRLEIRLAGGDSEGIPARRLEAKVFVFEESHEDGPHVTAVVGSSQGLMHVLATPAPGIESNVRLSGPINEAGGPCSQVREWAHRLLAESERVSEDALSKYATRPAVERKLAYKLDFDTAHELRLKHLAEQLCRRGRLAAPMCDATAVDPPAAHQRAAMALAAQPWTQGVLLLDESGLGKTVETGLILSRELRRRRIYASSDTTELRQALVVAPISLHEHWREELVIKFGLVTEVIELSRGQSWTGSDAQVVITSPEIASKHWEDIQGFEILVADECQLFDEQTYEALAGIRSVAQLCIVASGTPVQDSIGDLLKLAKLAAAPNRWATYEALAGEDVDAILGEELRAVAIRARRETINMPARVVVDHFYELDDVEAEAYSAVREMRQDYVERGSRATAWAFSALEQTFLSSMHAFVALARRLLDKGENAGRRTVSHFGDLVGAGDRADASFGLLASSSYFRRRLRQICEQVAPRVRPSSGISGKEASLLELLSSLNGQRVVLFTSYRASQQRLMTLLTGALCPLSADAAGAGLTGRVEVIDGSASLRERAGILRRFNLATETLGGDGPRGILLVTDAAAVGLNLHKVSNHLLNYDLPWDPQRLERRIGRLQRLGQADEVRVYNVAARNPKMDGWSMDNRVLYVCRKLFGMGDGDQPCNAALWAMGPLSLEQELSGQDDAEMGLVNTPDPQATLRLDRLLSDEGAAGSDNTARLRQSQQLDEAYRAGLTDFWSRVAYGASSLEGARGYLFARLRLALLQGAVGVLCAPGRNIDDCFTFHVAVGLRLLFESAELAPGEQVMDDDWLIEDEAVYLWAVAPDGKLVDWAEFLMGGGLVEVPRERAVKLAGGEVIDFLIAKKDELESRGLDSIPLESWMRGAPDSVRQKLAVVHKHGQAMAKTRMSELQQQWTDTRDASAARLRRRLEVARAGGSDEDTLTAIEQRITEVEQRQVRLRREIRGTQMFLITH